MFPAFKWENVLWFSDAVFKTWILRDTASFISFPSQVTYRIAQDFIFARYWAAFLHSEVHTGSKLLPRLKYAVFQISMASRGFSPSQRELIISSLFSALQDIRELIYLSIRSLHLSYWTITFAILFASRGNPAKTQSSEHAKFLCMAFDTSDKRLRYSKNTSVFF